MRFCPANSRPGFDINDVDSRIVRGAQTYAMLANPAANLGASGLTAVRINVRCAAVFIARSILFFASTAY